MTEKCILCEEIENESNKPSQTNYKITKTGKWLLAITGISFTGVIAITTPFILPAVRRICLPFVPATTTQVNNVMQLLGGKRGVMVDLGSGDGRIVIEAAKRGMIADGIELNPWLVWYSRLKALQQGVYKQAQFYRKDLFKTNFKKYDSIVVFGVDSMMESLETSLEKTVSKECDIIACRYPFPNWTPTCTVGEGIDRVWLYTPLKSRS